MFTADTTSACYPEVFNLSTDIDPALYTASKWEISNGMTVDNEDAITIGFEFPGTYDVTLTLTN